MKQRFFTNSLFVAVAVAPLPGLAPMMQLAGTGVIDASQQKKRKQRKLSSVEIDQRQM
jgi:hypothetical protein